MRTSHEPSFEDSGPEASTRTSLGSKSRRKARLSLFWRTFFLLSILLFASIVAWLQSWRAIEFEPRVMQSARQISALVNLSRTALLHSDSIARLSLVKGMADQEDVRISLREPSDVYLALDGDTLSREISKEVTARLGAGTVLARQVNGQGGLWVGFSMGRDNYWMRLDLAQLTPDSSKSWLVWLITAALVSLAGAALIAQLINRPLKELSFAASRVRDGDFEASRLDEKVATSEIREVNIGFNRMAQRLSKVEQDRALMLAGISHDLRTPLARLRLETELSVADEAARAHMAADISQLDAIIGKFLDYARPDHVELKPLLLREVIGSCLYAIKAYPDLSTNLDVPEDLMVLGDAVELSRVISNLLENARRYGKSPDTGLAVVDIAAKARNDTVLLKIRDHGMGVAPDALLNLTKPFFRGDAARTAAVGAGLGLSIVERNLQRMGGSLELVNHPSGGLSAHIRLKRAQRL
jgi:two-component system osmolarity sensor histidine kinase EnvZ